MCVVGGGGGEEGAGKRGRRIGTGVGGERAQTHTIFVSWNCALRVLTVNVRGSGQCCICRRSAVDRLPAVNPAHLRSLLAASRSVHDRVPSHVARLPDQTSPRASRISPERSACCVLGGHAPCSDVAGNVPDTRSWTAGRAGRPRRLGPASRPAAASSVGLVPGQSPGITVVSRRRLRFARREVGAGVLSGPRGPPGRRFAADPEPRGTRLQMGRA